MTLFCFLLSLPFLTIPALARQEKAAQPLKQDETCLACHGQPDMRSEKGNSIFSLGPRQLVISLWLRMHVEDLRANRNALCSFGLHVRLAMANERRLHRHWR